MSSNDPLLMPMDSSPADSVLGRIESPYRGSGWLDDLPFFGPVPFLVYNFSANPPPGETVGNIAGMAVGPDDKLYIVENISANPDPIPPNLLRWTFSTDPTDPTAGTMERLAPLVFPDGGTPPQSPNSLFFVNGQRGRLPGRIGEILVGVRPGGGIDEINWGPDGYIPGDAEELGQVHYAWGTEVGIHSGWAWSDLLQKCVYADGRYVRRRRVVRRYVPRKEQINIFGWAYPKVEDLFRNLDLDGDYHIGCMGIQPNSPWAVGFNISPVPNSNPISFQSLAINFERVTEPIRPLSKVLSPSGGAIRPWTLVYRETDHRWYAVWVIVQRTPPLHDDWGLYWLV